MMIKKYNFNYLKYLLYLVNLKNENKYLIIK